MRAQQEATHLTNLPWTVAGSLLGATLLLVALRNVVGAPYLASWLAVLVVALGARLFSARVHKAQLAELGAAPDAAFTRRWLLRHRIGFFVHGCVWGAACLLPLPASDAVHQAVLVVLLMTMAIASFTVTTFDMAAGLSFGTPVLMLLSLHLFTRPDPSQSTLGVAALVALGYMTLTARRAHRYVRGYVALRVAEAGQARALRDSRELLERTGASAGVGGWELDVATMALRVTNQVFRIHDLEPVDKPDPMVFRAHYAADSLTKIRAAIDLAVRRRRSFDLEARLTSAKGAQRWVRVLGQPHVEGGRVVRLNGSLQDITQTRLAEAALAEQHHLMDLLVKTTSEGFWFIDAERRTTDVNPAMCRILQRPREQIVGRTIFEFVDEANAAIFREQLAQRDQGTAGGYEIALQRADGTLVDCYNSATPIFDTRGRRTGAVGMWTDITERKRAAQRLQESGAQMRAMLDTFPGYIGVLDAQLAYSYANDRLVELIGRPRAEIIGQPMRKVLGEARFERLASVLRQLQGGRSITAETEYEAAPHREHLWLQVTYATGRDAVTGLPTYYAFGIDISARKKAEAALIAAKEEAERANRAKSQFV
ncbi:MAG TPA: PAS domain S-box protein, partial [Burkholderiaceae bacterium]|nr:PAS domain S-box protein [Burkholderiaceae bacterium]